MKRVKMLLMVVGVCVLGALLTGCRTRAAAPVNPRVRIADNLEGLVVVSDVRCMKGASDHSTFQATVVNCTGRELWLEWKVVWLDSEGMEIDSVASTWSSAAIAPRDMKGLKGTAPRADATDMRFYVRRCVR